MKRLFLIIFVFCFNFIEAQNDSIFIRKNIEPYSDKPVYKTDTIIFKNPNSRNILIGNTILPQTSSQQGTKSYGLFFEEFNVKDCLDNKSEPKPNKIIQITKKKNEWIIKALVYTNCCQDFLADVSVYNDNTVNIMFTNYGMYCFCSCPFEITYKFRVEPFDDLSKIKFVSINGEATTKLE